MSFGSQLKTELCKLKTSDCCRLAECYGIMLFGRFFSKDKISLLSENEALAHNFIFLLKKCFGIYEKVEASCGKRPMHKVSVTSADDRQKIWDTLGGDGIRRELLSKDCCRAAFIRGAFLSCGQAQDPEKGARIDLRIKDGALLSPFADILTETGITPNITARDGKGIIYFKKSEAVEDFITVMGAGHITLGLMDLKIIKAVRSDINRRNNAEMANTSKTVEASINQRAAIQYLIRKEKFDSLAPELQEIALLRMANHEATLTELCKLSSFPLTRSGLNHRLKRIMEIAEEYKRKEK